MCLRTSGKWRSAVSTFIALGLLAVGCAGPGPSPAGAPEVVGPQSPECVSVVGFGPADARDHSARATADESPAVLLHRAMLPGRRPQPVRISLSERRESSGQGFDDEVQELKLELEATLKRGETREGSVEAVLRLDRVSLSLGRPDVSGDMRSYDSSRDEPGRGNELADLMSIVAGAELEIVLDPSGRLVEVNGLDSLWRKAGVLAAPPGLLAAQWLFRDNQMGELLAEAIFPPMPAEAVSPGERWKAEMPANIMLAAKLNSRLVAELVEVDTGRARGPVGLIRMAGKLEPAALIYADSDPGLFPEVVSSNHQVDLTIAPVTHSLTQSSSRHLYLRMVMQAPDGQTRREMSIKQTRRLTAERGRLRE